MAARSHPPSGATERPISITGAVLGQMRLRTSRGEIDAPAWIFATLAKPLGIRTVLGLDSFNMPAGGNFSSGLPEIAITRAAAGRRRKWRRPAAA